jgi:type IV pilus assembly protein PilW
MQESARYAFEVMARSLREAGGNLCGASKVANVLNNASSKWWSNWNRGEGIYGYEGNDNSFPKAFGTGRAERVSGTDAVVVWSGTLNEGLVITQHNPPSAQFKVNTTQHGLEDGDIVMACDNKDHAAIFQVTNANSSNVTIVHNTGASVSPGNCSKYLGYPVPLNCGQPPGNSDPPSYTFENGGFISKLAAYAWYIGYNGRGGCSLYRLKLQNDDGKAKDTAEEVAEGVSNLQIQYLIAGNTDYVDARPDLDWTNVVAVRLEFTLHSLDEVAVGKTVDDSSPCKIQEGKRVLERRWNTVVTLRNRVPVP